MNFVGVAGKPSFPFQFHINGCKGERQFVLEIRRPRCPVVQTRCCACDKKTMRDVMELINKYCFDSYDFHRRFFFYEGGELISEADLTVNQVKNQKLTVSVFCERTPVAENEESEVLASDSGSWSSFSEGESPVGSDTE